MSIESKTEFICTINSNVITGKQDKNEHDWWENVQICYVAWPEVKFKYNDFSQSFIVLGFRHLCVQWDVFIPLFPNWGTRTPTAMWSDIKNSLHFQIQTVQVQFQTDL